MRRKNREHAKIKRNKDITKKRSKSEGRYGKSKGKMRRSMAEISANDHFKVPKPSKSQTKRRSGSRKKKPLNNSSIMRSIEDQENMHPNTGDVYPTFGQTPLGETRPIDLSNIKSSSSERTGEEEEQVHFSEMDVSHELIP